MAAMPPRAASAPGSTGKNRPCAAQLVVQLAVRVTPAWTVASRSSVDRAQDAVHCAHVDADPAAHRQDVPLERRSGAEGHDRRRRGARQAPDDRHGTPRFVRREDDGVGAASARKRPVRCRAGRRTSSPGLDTVGPQQGGPSSLRAARTAVSTVTSLRTMALDPTPTALGAWWGGRYLHFGEAAGGRPRLVELLTPRCRDRHRA